jgi:TIR domain
MAGRVFISYRRDDTASAAGWLSDRLAGHLGRQQVFKDVDSIPLGDDAAQVIAAAVASCDAFVVLVGRRWLTASGPDGTRRLADPNDFVRLEIESALARDVCVIPVLIDGARMPQPGELPPSLAALAARPPLEFSQNRLEADTMRLLQVLDQSLARTQATQPGPVAGPPTVTAYRPSGAPQAGQPPAGPPSAGQPYTGPPPTREGPPRPLRQRRRRTLIATLAAGLAVVAGIVAFLAIPGSHPKPPAKATSHRASEAKPSSSASPATAQVILADDFSTQRVNWTDDAHQAAGSYTGTGAYRLSVTGANGQAELARPASAAHGLSDVTPLNLSVTVEARKLAGAAQATATASRSAPTAAATSTPSSSWTTPWPSRSGWATAPTSWAAPPRSTPACTRAPPTGCGPWP